MLYASHTGTEFVSQMCPGTIQNNFTPFCKENLKAIQQSLENNSYVTLSLEVLCFASLPHSLYFNICRKYTIPEYSTMLQHRASDGKLKYISR